MKKAVFSVPLLGALVILCPHSAQSQGTSKVPYSDCGDIAQTWFVNLTTTPPVQTTEDVLGSFRDISKHKTSFASVAPFTTRTSMQKALAESLQALNNTAVLREDLGQQVPCRSLREARRISRTLKESPPTATVVRSRRNSPRWILQSG
jgi:hypothetical protein